MASSPTGSRSARAERLTSHTLLILSYKINSALAATIRAEPFQPETRVVVDTALANLIAVYQAVRTPVVLFSRHIRLVVG